MMRRLIVGILCCVVLCSIFARVGVVAQTGGSTTDVAATTAGEVVDIKADLIYPYKVNDSLTVLCLVGNFSAQHNGAVITADSAVRYDDERLACYRNVLINKNTTYAYADEADYDSSKNIVSLYSPLIKVVDQDVTMYSYNFSFNTLDNIGLYWGGGVTIQRDSLTGEEDLMESKRGYYYADDKQVVGVESVELSGKDYLMMGDSVIYEMEGKRALFFENTNIWSDDDSYIYGDRGLYDREANLYVVDKSGYFLTEDQEAWSDSLEYYRDREMAILRSNIQIDDTTNKSLAFGDYAQYWGDVEEILLTRRPSVINYDKEQGDSLFLRGDTIRIFSYAVGTGPVAEMHSDKDSERERLMAELRGDVVEPESEEELVEEESVEHNYHDHHHDHHHSDEEHIDEESVVDTLPTKRELKARIREAKMQQRRDAYELKEYRKLVDRRDKLSARIEERRAKGRSIYADSVVLQRVLGELQGTEVVQDSLHLQDSLHTLDSLAEAVEKEAPERDSLYRIVKVYRNAKTYRSDSQMACDSMVAISYDTTLRLYINPLLWNGKNQISSEEMNIYTKDGNLDYADFIDNPIMSSQVFPDDTVYFNQVSGKSMTAFFVNNNVERNDVDGNVQTVYYLQDENTKEVTTLANIESGSASFFIKDQSLDGVVYRLAPNYVFAPIEKIPSDMKRDLPGFGWYADQRPTRDMVFDRTIRPSIREEKSALDRPTFPLKFKIDADRARLVQKGLWQDRSDGVSADATEWMISLGFTPGEPRESGSLDF